MPLPNPEQGESQESFLERCMTSDTVMAEYPDQEQRLAACQNQFQVHSSGVSNEPEKPIAAHGEDVLTSPLQSQTEIALFSDDAIEFSGQQFTPDETKGYLSALGRKFGDVFY